MNFWKTIGKWLCSQKQVSNCKPLVEQSNIDKTKINWDFIKELEGFETVGYVPSEKNEIHNNIESGVTICAGFDLGQHNEEDLEWLNLPPKLYDKLMPYGELQGRVARQYLEKYPLKLTEREAAIVDLKVKESCLKNFLRVYDKRKPYNHRFEELPPCIQTVVMSVAFQYGTMLHKRTPKFYTYLMSRDYKRMIRELENFGDSFKRRRLIEAKHIRKGLKI